MRLFGAVFCSFGEIPMCKFQVTVSTTTPQEFDRAHAKLKRLPHVTAVDGDDRSVFAIVDHPENLSQIRAAAWAKDIFGHDPVLLPSVKMV